MKYVPKRLIWSSTYPISVFTYSKEFDDSIEKQIGELLTDTIPRHLKIDNIECDEYNIVIIPELPKTASNVNNDPVCGIPASVRFMVFEDSALCEITLPTNDVSGIVDTLMRLRKYIKED